MRKLLSVTVLAALALAGCTQATPSAGSTPKACLDALDAGADIMGVSADAISVAGDVIGAIPEALIAANANDMRGLEKFSEQLEGKTDEIIALTLAIESSDYPALAEECRAGA